MMLWVLFAALGKRSVSGLRVPGISAPGAGVSGCGTSSSKVQPSGSEWRRVLCCTAPRWASVVEGDGIARPRASKVWITLSIWSS